MSRRLAVEQLSLFPPSEFSCSTQTLTARAIAPQEYVSVLEQRVIENAPEHTANRRVLEQPDHSALTHTHWTETYTVRRGDKKHLYYRYCWMDGRKIYHVHLPGGNTMSDRARALFNRVTAGIKKGDTPTKIKALIKNARSHE